MPDLPLSLNFPIEFLKTILIPQKDWRPYPTAADRTAWDGLPGGLRQALIQIGEAALTRPWPHLPATLYLGFTRSGDRHLFEEPYFTRRGILAALVMAECLEGSGRFVDGIADAVWSICEESGWELPAHQDGLSDPSDPVVDLFAAETAALLAWTAYLVGPSLAGVSSKILPRLVHEVDTRVLSPSLIRDDFWWMGFSERKVNNWNPWINSNWLTAVLLLESDEERRTAAVAKILRSLDRFLASYPRDGGCDEGPSYWGRAGASLYDSLELLALATAGQLDIFHTPLVKEIGRYIYRAHIAGDYYLNFADAPAALSPDAALIFNFGKRIADPAMTSFGAWLARRNGLDGSKAVYDDDDSPSLGRVLPALLTLKELLQQPAEPALLRDVWLDEIQVMAARDRASSDQGFYLAAKGGHNDESHNHNDVGSFVVYTSGKPLLVDLGVETYTRKTFSSQRYEIWTMQSAYHNLPTINNKMQSPGASYKAQLVEYSSSEESACFSLDLAGAYPPEADLIYWRRSITLFRGKTVEIEDAYETKTAPASLYLSLITPCKAESSQAGTIRLMETPLSGALVSGTGTLHFEPGVFIFKIEEIEIEDAQLQRVWETRLSRVLLCVRQPAKTGRWAVRITM